MLSGQWRRGHDPNLPGLVGLASLASLSRPWPPASLPRSAHGCRSRLLLWPEFLSRRPPPHSSATLNATLRRPTWYVCVCTLSPGWSPSSVVRMHPGSDPASPPQLSSSASPPQLSSSASPPQLSSSASPPQLSSSASPPQLYSNASRHVPIGIESLILAIRTTDSDPTGAPTEHPRRFCVSAPLSWSYERVCI